MTSEARTALESAERLTANTRVRAEEALRAAAQMVSNALDALAGAPAWDEAPSAAKAATHAHTATTDLLRALLILGDVERHEAVAVALRTHAEPPGKACIGGALLNIGPSRPLSP